MNREKYNKESVDLTFPSLDDAEGWRELEKVSNDFANDHVQSGLISPAFSSFGVQLATNSLRRFAGRVGRVRTLLDAGFIDKDNVILNNESRIARNALHDASYVDHEKVNEMREALEWLSPQAKYKQNQIFTKVLERDLEKNQFILQAVNPNVRVKDSLMAYFLDDSAVSYDFVGRLTEKDENGSPVLSDLTFENFFNWYQANLAKRQKELKTEFIESIKDYKEHAEKVVAGGRLPECFSDNLTMLDPDSENARDFNFYIFDLYGSAIDTQGAYTECKFDSRSAPIGISAKLAFGKELGHLSTLWHEITHAIAGDKMIFYNFEAERIFNEAMTEHISNIVTIGDDTDYWEPEEYAFMSGFTYAGERATLNELAKSGAIKIDPNLFYEAYAEWDHEFEAKEREIEASSDPLARMEMGAQPRIGPKKRALYDALFAAFPECKTRADLGKLIVDKFNNYRSARRLKK